ncbi:hypothetical protein UK23_13970 [Lentzea aerocolonigenes]|uniref:Gram-positive cocci surface proteins LPxTG domain-containing protein n=1 Tax=Lentzea aerocolonigenes TaxID=68170 RepID=A0A0F0H523_LENAE|nr:hypothetical protein [Lentzea aerocolonigenes]KJK49402.1 hypothetical protein UK23_13970 [Lentzea aerocolonigenes]
MRIFALICAFLLLSAPSAVAGGWAVTYLDPVPSIQPSTTHTAGYWVLQHGTHPFSGDLGKTGLRFVSGADSHEFVGVPLGQPAHYAVTFTLPAGSYEVFGVQGMFQDHPLGTLTVPGTFQITPPDPQLVMPGSTEPWPWQEIAPPLAKPAVAPAAAVVPSEPEPSPAPVWLVGLVVVAAAGLFVVLRKRLRPVGRR